MSEAFQFGAILSSALFAGAALLRAAGGLVVGVCAGKRVRIIDLQSRDGLQNSGKTSRTPGDLRMRRASKLRQLSVVA